jgi:phosphoglycerate kinase
MSAHYFTMDEVDINNKRLIIREDFNVPMEKGKISDVERIERAIPTIKKALSQNASVLILSHLGRPKEGEFDAQFSLAPVATILSEKLGQPVRFEKDWLHHVAKPGEVVLGENVRFNVGEKNNDPALSQKMADLCDVFVMDAFATAHRAEASTVGIAEYAPVVCAGLLLDSELRHLSQAFSYPKKPLLAIVGGSKVSTKFELLENLLNKVDVLIVGGGIANTFLKAEGYDIGKSLYEESMLEQARKLITLAKAKGVNLPLPVDVVVATEFSETATPVIKSISKDDGDRHGVNANEMILDIGPKTSEIFAERIKEAATIVWNGPVGVFEFPAFSAGTRALGEAIAKSQAFSVAGGGDTLSALTKFNLMNKISYVSTGGGAFLEYLQGETLPGVAVLEKKGKP